MRIYTGTGDTGETSLYGGARVSKDSVRVEAYGTLDELNAALGVAAAHLEDTELRELVTELQNELFTVGADLATPSEKEAVGSTPVPRVTEADALRIEQHIDRYDSQNPPLRTFILPGGSPAAAYLHLARTVARRAERRTVHLWHAEPDGVNPHLLRYLNRLTDLLFVLARAANYRASIADVPWTKPQIGEPS